VQLAEQNPGTSRGQASTCGTKRVAIASAGAL